MNREEAINVVRCNWPEGRHQLSEALKTLIPELQDSEDERIRQEIVGFIDNVLKDKNVLLLVADRIGDNIPSMIPGWIAYLEKQKEQKPERINITEMVAKYRVTDEYVDGEYKGKPVNCMIRAYEQGIRDTLLKVKEQKPAEWSEEDERVIHDAHCWLDEYAGFLVSANKDKAKMLWKLSEKLKSLRPQPQRRDTYYDIIHDILATLKDMDFMKITPEHRVSLLNDIRVKCKNADECAAILDEPHWKPSEEQMQALGIVLEYHAFASTKNKEHIKSLYNDLNKL